VCYSTIAKLPYSFCRSRALFSVTYGDFSVKAGTAIVMPAARREVPQPGPGLKKRMTFCDEDHNRFSDLPSIFTFRAREVRQVGWILGSRRDEGGRLHDSLTLALLSFLVGARMDAESSREITISTLHALIDLQREEEKRLRSLIIETTSSEVRLEAILDLEDLLHQIKLKLSDLAKLEPAGVPTAQ
jgi:hypothetical protein